MLTDITIGQYFPGNSMIHQLDPRGKVMILLLLIAGVFMVNTWISYALLCTFALLAMLTSRVPLVMFFKSIKPLWWILLFTFLIHALVTNGDVLWKAGPFTVTVEGVRQGSLISIRLMLLILLSSLLTFTTSPIALTDALERMMGPFRKFGVPAHELAMMMTIALRFIPTLLEEADRIMKAQSARGADFSSGNIAKRVRNMIPLLVPLFISAFRRADDLALAMEARCYHGGENRTRMRVLAITSVDYLAALLTAAVLGALLLMRMRGL